MASMSSADTLVSMIQYIVVLIKKTKIMTLRDKISILYTGSRTFAEEKAKNDERQQIYGDPGKMYYHRGTDILSKTGTDAHSLLCGEVANFGYKTSFKTNQYEKNSLGNTVVIKSKDKENKVIYIKYGHLDSASVKKGDKVIHGQVIAKSGSTGHAATILYTSGLKKGQLKNGIKKEYRHIHIEASKNENFPNSRTGSENDPETYMKTKFDKDGKVIK